MPRYASRLIKALRKYQKRKIVDLAGFRAAKVEAATLAGEATAEELLEGLTPEHRLLATAHNLLSVQFEVLAELPEMSRFAEAFIAAEDQYLPSGPPMSPLTSSYFHCWAFYDLAIQPAYDLWSRAEGRGLSGDELRALVGYLCGLRPEIAVRHETGQLAVRTDVDPRCVEEVLQFDQTIVRESPTPTRAMKTWTSPGGCTKPASSSTSACSTT
jgi:hypothetical protein